MNKIFQIFSLLLFSISIYAQVPQSINYQGVAADNNGVELINQTIALKIGIISGSANGNLEWEEVHSAQTDSFGLFSINIGQGVGTAQGSSLSFNDIQWGSASHFLKIEIDINNSGVFSLVGTNQMLSVPYALYAETTGNNIWEKDSSNNISYNSANVNIGTNQNNSSAVLNIQSNNKGIMLPKMRMSERDSISNPSTGLLIFQIDNNPGFYYYNGNSWQIIGGGTAFDPTLIYTTDGF